MLSSMYFKNFGLIFERVIFYIVYVRIEKRSLWILPLVFSNLAKVLGTPKSQRRSDTVGCPIYSDDFFVRIFIHPCAVS